MDTSTRRVPPDLALDAYEEINDWVRSQGQEPAPWLAAAFLDIRAALADRFTPEEAAELDEAWQLRFGGSGREDHAAVAAKLKRIGGW